MAEAGVDAFLVPRADAHQGENVAPRDERLAWLTGFTGSAGLAVVTRDRAAIFVDGRYRLQVRGEVDLDAFEVLRHPEDKPEDWLIAALPGGGRVGFDPWLHTAKEIETLAEALGPRQIALVRVANLVDRAWPDQPPPPARPVVPHPDELAGRSSAEKRAELARGLADARPRRGGADAARLDRLAAERPRLGHRPHAGAARLRHPRRRRPRRALHRAVRSSTRGRAPTSARRSRSPRRRPSARRSTGLRGRVAVDRATAPVWVADRLEAAGAEVVWERDPCILPKAQKNEAELAGIRAAHLRDGAAVATFLAWLEATAPEGGLTEIDVVRRLECARSAGGALRDISFDTICGAGPNGAIVHYRVSEASNRPVAPGELLLVDSGAQYPDGTTDITRTVAIGPVPPEAIRPFTLVLKGMIAMSRLRWPEGLAGRDIDAVARAPLWRAGLDYDHGTGHGVGAYLGVHEGPASLSRRGTEPLLPGMILSIEPGYYREGGFGIRCENLGAVMPPAVPEGGDRPMLGFETLTLAPFDRRLIDPALLDAGERAWLDAYHARVVAALTPLVERETAIWLASACDPL